MRRTGGIVVAGAALVLAAYAFANSELLVPGIGFLLLGLTGPWMWISARSASVTRSIDTERVLEDQPLEARIQVRGGLLGLPGAEIVDPLAGTRIRLSGSAGRAASRTTEVLVVGRFPRRGRHQLDPPALALADPLGLVRIVRISRSSPHSLLVLPKTERVRWLAGPSADQLDRQSGAAAAEALAALEVDGLRPYRPGTPASRISWTALARGAGLLERRLRAERDVGPLVVLDLRSDGPREEIDAAVRAAASLTLEMARRTGCELLLPGDRRPVQIGSDLCAWPAAHARLALMEGGPGAPAPWPPSGARSGTVFYVAAAPRRLPARLLRGASGGVVLVLPAQVAPGQRAVPRFDVSGCRGYVIGERGAGMRTEGRAA